MIFNTLYCSFTKFYVIFSKKGALYGNFNEYHQRKNRF